MEDSDYKAILERASNPDPLKKTCARCNRLKFRSEFNTRATARDGLLGHCKTCASIDTKKWRTRNHEALKARNQRAVELRREKARVVAAETLVETQRMAALIADCKSWAKK